MEQASRNAPTVVKVAVALLFLSYTMAVLVYILEPAFVLETWNPSFVIATKVTIFTGGLVVLWMIYLGRKWARLTFLVLFMVDLVHTVPRYISAVEIYPQITGVAASSSLAGVLALIILHLPGARSWYARDRRWPCTRIGNAAATRVGLPVCGPPAAPSAAIVLPIVLLLVVAFIEEVFGGTVSARYLRPVTQANLLFMMGFGIVFLVVACGLLLRQLWAAVLFVAGVPVLGASYIGYFLTSAAYSSVPSSAHSNLTFVTLVYIVALYPILSLWGWLRSGAQEKDQGYDPTSPS